MRGRARRRVFRDPASLPRITMHAYAADRRRPSIISRRAGASDARMNGLSLPRCFSTARGREGPGHRPHPRAPPLSTPRARALREALRFYLGVPLGPLAAAWRLPFGTSCFASSFCTAVDPDAAAVPRPRFGGLLRNAERTAEPNESKSCRARREFDGFAPARLFSFLFSSFVWAAAVCLLMSRRAIDW